MTTVTISADDSRSIKALEIAAGASQWLKVRSVTTGELCFGIPSQCHQKTNRYYLVTAQACDCEDFKRRGLSAFRTGLNGNHNLCKHIRAVQLHEELVKASAQARPKRRRLHIVNAAARYDQIFGEEPAF